MAALNPEDVITTDAISPEVLERISFVPSPPELYIDMSLIEWKSLLSKYFHVVHRVELKPYSELLQRLSGEIAAKPTRDYLYKRAFLNFYAKQRLESIEDFKACINLNPSDHEAMYYVGVCYRTLRNAQEAIKFFNQAIDINSSIAKYFVRRGLSYSDSKDNNAAMRDFDYALQLRPDYAKAFNARGISRGDMKQHDLALADFQTALKIRPDYFKSYLNRANVYADMKCFDEAIRDYSKGIELQPRFFKAYSNRGHLYHEQGRWKEALSDFQAAIFIAPDYVNSLFNLGILYLDLERHSDALSCFRKAVEIDPKDADCWAFIADIYFTLKNYKEAVVYFTKSLECDISRRSYYNRALANFYVPDYEQTIVDINNFEQTKPTPEEEALTDEMALLIRGSALWALGDAEGALDDLERGSKTDNSRLRWESRKAVCYQRLGKLDDCLRNVDIWCQQYIQLVVPDERENIRQFIMAGDLPPAPQLPNAAQQQHL